jgi:cell division protease FtsH
VQNDLQLEPRADAPSPEAQLLGIESTEEAPPFDCGHFLASHMLRSAMGKTRKPLPLGLYIMQAPSDGWCAALKDVMLDVYLDGQLRGRKRILGSGLPKLRVLELPSTADRKQSDQLTTTVQEALALDKTVIVIAGSLANVPVALQRASDQIFKVPAPRRQFVSALIRKLDPTARRLEFRGLSCEALIPSILRLAYRRDSSANAFLRRLRAMISPAPDMGVGKTVPLDQLHGVDEAKRWAMDLKADLTRYRQGQLAWRELSRGLLLAGPPGTGKTTLAGSIASFCGLAFVATSYAAWQRAGNGHLGDVLRAMAAVFAEARSHAPALLFIDELDSLGSRGQGSQHGDWWRSVINASLEQIDGSTSNEGVIFVGASNYPELIDPAILRSGRMEERITLRHPDIEALTKIYRDQLEGECGEAVDLRSISQMSAGMTGADVVKTCATARRRARNAGRLVTYDDLAVAIAGGETRLDHDRQLRVAIHEAGHAIAALTSPALTLGHVTIVGRGDMSGGVSFGPKVEAFMTPAVVDTYLTAMLAGRAAEEILLGEISSGAGGRDGCDLSRATLLAAEAELSLGMRDRGLIWYAPLTAEKLAQLFAQRPDIERAVRERLDHAYGRARELVRAKAPLIRRLARKLLASKVMTSAEIAALVREAGGVDFAPAKQRTPDGRWMH